MACLAIEGRGVGNMSGKQGHSQLHVEGCTSACRGLVNMFDERTGSPLNQGASEAERKAAERLGRELVKKVKVGAYVGIQNRAGDEDDVFWVAKVVRVGLVIASTRTSTRRSPKGPRFKASRSDWEAAWSV